MQAKPDGYSCGSPGVGTARHLLVELIGSKMPLAATHVPLSRLGQVTGMVRDPMVDRLNGELNKALLDPIFIQRLSDVGLATMPLTVEAFGELIKRDAVRWAELIKLSGAKAG